jgi:Tol biopolymer transport system component
MTLPAFMSRSISVGVFVLIVACQTAMPGATSSPTHLPVSPPVTQSHAPSSSGPTGSATAATPENTASAPADGLILFAEGFREKGTGRLVSIWPDGTHRTEVFSSNMCCFAASPDGSRLLVQVDIDQALTMNPAGGERVPLARPDPNLQAELFIWSPTGENVVFHGFKFDDKDLAAAGAYSIGVESDGALVRLTTGNDRPIAFSPDGSKLLFLRERALEPGQSLIADLYIADADGSDELRLNTELQPLPAEPDEGPPAAFSPDGQTIAFSAFNKSGELAVYTMGLDGSGQQAITVAGTGPYVRWSPDGRWIAFGAMSGEKWQVFVVRPDGTDIHPVTAFSTGACCPAWSPDSLSLTVSGPTVVSLDGAGRLTSLRGDTEVGLFAYAWIR